MEDTSSLLTLTSKVWFSHYYYFGNR